MNPTEKDYENIPEPTEPLAIVNVSETSNPKAAIKYFSNPAKQVKDGFYGELETGAAVGTPAELTELMLANHHDRRQKRVCRTMVLSVQTPPDAQPGQLADIDRRLLKACLDLHRWLKKAHKVMSLLGWIHGNSATRHMHIIFPNSDGERQLDLTPSFMRELQRMAWTVYFESGRGKGKNPTPVNYYLQQKVALAAILYPKGKLNKAKWNELLAAGKISNLRQREDGSIISFEYNNRRFRLSGLKDVFKPRKPNNDMITIINPNKPLPQAAADAFADCGVTSAEVQEILRDVREALGVIAAAPAEPKQDVEQPKTDDIS